MIYNDLNIGDCVINIDSIDRIDQSEVLSSFTNEKNQEKIKKIDAFLNDAKTALVAGLRIKGANPETIALIDNFGITGIVNYFYDSNKILNGHITKDLSLDDIVIIMRVAQKTLKYAIKISELGISDQIPQFKVAKDITNIVAKVLQSSTFFTKTLITSEKIYNEKALTIKNCVSILKSSSIAYIIGAPLIMSSAPYLSVIRAIADISIILSFAYDIEQIVYPVSQALQIDDDLKSENQFPLSIIIE